MNNTFTPEPIDISHIELDEELLSLAEIMAENSHENWAVSKIAAGYTYGEKTDSAAKKHAMLVPYHELSRSEKEYDVSTSVGTLKLLRQKGFVIKRKNAGN